MAHTLIDGKRVYGRRYAYGSMGPTNISINSYKLYKNILEEAEYTKSWLDNKYNKNFPDISFKLSKINKIDYSTLVKVANLIGIKYYKSHIKPTRGQLIVLRRSVATILNRAQ